MANGDDCPGKERELNIPGRSDMRERAMDLSAKQKQELKDMNTYVLESPSNMPGVNLASTLPSDLMELYGLCYKIHP